MDIKTIKLDVLKKNRKYFACKKNGYKCRLVIDENSKDLEVGQHELMVNDVSVRTKYGTDLIYKLAADAKEQAESGFVTLSHFTFNQDLVDDCKNLGGKYDNNVWVFSDIVADKVDELDFLYNSELIAVEITALEDIREWHAPVSFMGYSIARAFGRDSGAKLANDVSMIKGGYDSGGSMKNWVTRVDEGSVFRLKVPSELFKIMRKGESEIWKIEVIEKGE